MGFGSFFKHLVAPVKKVVKKVVKNPIKVIPAAIATGGVSLVSPTVARYANTAIQPLYSPQVALGVVTRNPALIASGLQGGSSPMSLNLGGLIGGLSGALGTLTQNTNYAGVGQVAQFVGGTFQSSLAQQQQAQQVANRAPSGVMVVPGRAVALVANPILNKIRQKLLRNVSLTWVISLIRRMASSGLAPAAIATALGIAVNDLASLIVANQQRKRRRMNPANVHALRRSMRRIKSFHKLAARADVLSSRRRRTSARCGTCRKSPCAC